MSKINGEPTSLFYGEAVQYSYGSPCVGRLTILDLFALLSALETIAAGLVGCNTETPAISVARLPKAAVVVSAVR
jgi:hypothetical protein